MSNKDPSKKSELTLLEEDTSTIRSAISTNIKWRIFLVFALTGLSVLSVHLLFKMNALGILSLIAVSGGAYLFRKATIKRTVLYKELDANLKAINKIYKKAAILYVPNKN